MGKSGFVSDFLNLQGLDDRLGALEEDEGTDLMGLLASKGAALYFEVSVAMIFVSPFRVLIKRTFVYASNDDSIRELQGLCLGWRVCVLLGKFTYLRRKR